MVSQEDIEIDGIAPGVSPRAEQAGDRRGPRTSATANESRRRRKAATSKSTNSFRALDWSPPALETGFQTRIGASVVEEFVAGHDASDVLRELVQNEFDAGGNRVSITFGETALIISGNGNSIDAAGWSRLDVILGTGKVVGGKEDVNVEAKQSGIGSKNFGLRSLFLFGDRIHVRSGGHMAVLDLPTLGTQRITDPISLAQSGVNIYVPYRTKTFQTLEPFTVERERETLNRMADGLLATLVKLALVGKRRGIRELTLRSERTNRELSWNQTAEPVRCKMPSVSAIRRIGRLTDRSTNAGEPNRTTTYEEIEFVRAVPIPVEHVGQIYPAYYRAPGNLLKICVSLPVRRKRVDTSHPGNFYYPLQAAHGKTGSAMSVSAPFKLDADRTELQSNDWNEWLSLQAANLVVALLTGDWMTRYGVDAYFALLPIGASSPQEFAKRVRADLQAQPCWPTQATNTAQAWARASDLVIAASAELNGFLEPSKYLSVHLSEKESIVALAVECGAKIFTLNSLVRLRSGAKDAKLATKLIETEANYHFSNYAVAATEVERQRSMAEALTKLSRQLSNPNRKDLRLTASTLAGDGSLSRPDDLIRVESAMWDVCPAPVESRLHRSLLGFRVIANLCKPFEIDAWIQKAAARAADETIELEEREALYERLISEQLKLSPKALALVRRSPVMKDHRGDWVTPEAMALLPTAQAAVLEPVLHAPARDLAKRPALMRRLRIRRILIGDDLVKFATTVAEYPERAGPLEDLLKNNLRLLMPRTLTALGRSAFLRSQSGSIAKPHDLHIDNAGNRACLENGDAIVAGENVSLYRRLGCCERPSSGTLLALLSRLRERGSASLRPEVLYPVLVAALRVEKASIAALSDEHILWIDGGFRTPHDSLIGQRVPRWFRDVAPVFRGPEAVRDAFEQLGASLQPREHHWVAFFRSLHQRYQQRQAMAQPERRSVLEAYQRRASAGLPPDLKDDVRCLLGRDGLLYSLSEMQSSTFLEDDYPALGETMSKEGSKVGFALITDDSRVFYHQLGLQRLSVVCGVPHLSAGLPTSSVGWFRLSHEAELLGLIRRRDFAIALHELAWAYQRGTHSSFRALSSRDLERRLTSIERLSFVSSVTRDYQLMGQTFSVPAEAAVFDDSIALLPARSKFELDQMLAHALAELAGATRILDARPLATSILPLLLCRTGDDFLNYLRRQGIQPPAWVEIEEETDELPTEESSDPDAEAILRQMLGSLNTRPQQSPSAPIAPSIPPPPPNPPSIPLKPPPFVLPALDSVQISVESPSGDGPKPRAIPSSGGGWHSSSWTPPNAFDLERDRMVGQRGEALAYQLEIERLRATGYEKPEDVVVWTSGGDAGADHDICSIAEDGKPLWIEVKSTVGNDGRFEWSRREFEKAMREREHYEIWRIYEAHTATPTVKKFRDPAALLAKSELVLELSSLRAFVEPKN
jgi:Domain of unknown function (DUF3883)